MKKMITGPDFVALQVRNLDISRKFWVEKVGMTELPGAPPGAVLFDTKPIPFAIRTPHVDLNAVDKLGWGIALWMHSDYVKALYDQLIRSDVKIISKIMPGAFGDQFTFEDPDGYSIIVHGNK